VAGILNISQQVPVGLVLGRNFFQVFILLAQFGVLFMSAITAGSRISWLTSVNRCCMASNLSNIWVDFKHYYKVNQITGIPYCGCTAAAPAKYARFHAGMVWAATASPAGTVLPIFATEVSFLQP
jgi:hypothetical protein